RNRSIEFFHRWRVTSWSHRSRNSEGNGSLTVEAPRLDGDTFAIDELHKELALFDHGPPGTVLHRDSHWCRSIRSQNPGPAAAVDVELATDFLNEVGQQHRCRD